MKHEFQREGGNSILGFLSPSGMFYECKYFEHLSLADMLLDELYKDQSNNPVDKLCKYGWVVIQSSFIGFAGDDAYHTPQLTREQRKWLEENKNDMSYDQRIGLELCTEINDMIYE